MTSFFILYIDSGYKFFCAVCYVWWCCVQFSDLIIPTIDTARQSYFLKVYLSHEVPLLFVGPTGTGKTAITSNYLLQLPKERFVWLAHIYIYNVDVPIENGLKQEKPLLTLRGLVLFLTVTHSGGLQIRVGRVAYPDLGIISHKLEKKYKTCKTLSVAKVT